jgi:hypothetical protein
MVAGRHAAETSCWNTCRGLSFYPADAHTDAIDVSFSLSTPVGHLLLISDFTMAVLVAVAVLEVIKKLHKGCKGRPPGTHPPRKTTL